MLGFLLKLALIWWIVNALFKWFGKQKTPRESGRQEPVHPVEEKDPGVVHSGAIDDAEFEEMDDR